MLGVAPLFGRDTLPSIEKSIISTTHSFFSSSVVNEIIEPTIRDVTANARGEVVSLGFVISLWAGSSAISSYVDAVVEAHDQTPLRHPVRQRLFALFLYVVMLVVAVGAADAEATHGPRAIAETPSARITISANAHRLGNRRVSAAAPKAASPPNPRVAMMPKRPTSRIDWKPGT